MSDNEDEEEKPTRAQLEAAYPGRTFMDGRVSENQLAAAYPEVADAEGDGVSIPEDELEDLEDIRKNSSWSGIHSWHFHQLQQFITYKAERAGIRVEKVDPYRTSQLCSECGSIGTRDEDYFSCSECDRGRHADLNASENIAQREGEPCTA
jgi:hypothetical protein